jgi:HAMP domain-containing protein
MLAAEHLHTDALLVVLLSTVFAVAMLRVIAAFLQRARVARDRSQLAKFARDHAEAGMPSATTPVAERDPYEHSEPSL